jgi:hypothetical protein
MREPVKNARGAQRSGEDAADQAAENAEQTGREAARAGRENIEQASDTARDVAERGSEAFRDVASRGAEAVRDLTGRGAEVAREATDRSREIFQQQSERMREVARSTADVFGAAAEASRRDMNMLLELNAVWGRSLQEFGSEGYRASQQSLERIVDAVRSVREAQSELIRESVSALLNANARVSEMSAKVAHEALDQIEQQGEQEKEQDQDEQGSEVQQSGGQRDKRSRR